MWCVIVPLVTHAGRERATQDSLPRIFVQFFAHWLTLPTSGKWVWQQFVGGERSSECEQQ